MNCIFKATEELPTSRAAFLQLNCCKGMTSSKPPLGSQQKGLGSFHHSHASPLPHLPPWSPMLPESPCPLSPDLRAAPTLPCCPSSERRPVPLRTERECLLTRHPGVQVPRDPTFRTPSPCATPAPRFRRPRPPESVALTAPAVASSTAAAAIATGSQGNQLSRYLPRRRREPWKRDSLENEPGD
ncbi:mCG1027471 [Mus musculus]|nr:mCG1027471 [Mus musculus]